MSIEAISWALETKMPFSAAKFVLVALCNYGDSNGHAWASTNRLSEITCQDEKTVERSIARLRAWGFIKETRYRRGKTKSCIVYALQFEVRIKSKDGKDLACESDEELSSNTPNLGGAYENEAPPNLCRSSPKFPEKLPQICAEAPPNLGDRTLIEPKENLNRTLKTDCVDETDFSEPAEKDLKPLTVNDLVREGVSRQIAMDWFRVRKDKRCTTLTWTAWGAFRTEARKAGLTHQEAVRQCAESNWAGFKAYYLNDGNQGNGRARVNKQEALEASNTDVVRRLIEKRGITYKEGGGNEK